MIIVPQPVAQLTASSAAKRRRSSEEELFHQLRNGINEETKDEIIEDIWKIKEHFSISCNKNVRELVQLVNDIAKKQGFDKTVNNRGNIAYSASSGENSGFQK